MSNHCALCGRLTLNPAVRIGALPVGPKCARRAGLMPLAQRRLGALAPANQPHTPRKSPVLRDDRTPDLFEVNP